jgi:PIN domain nuclease of toxin-antitoxin system
MQLLLDTHVLLWALLDDERLTPAANDAICDGRNVVYASAVSVWEVAIKRSLGKLRAPIDIVAAIDQARFTQLPITLHHADAVAALPDLHRDPFDRILVAQANVDRLTLVTHDSQILRYDVATLEV